LYLFKTKEVVIVVADRQISVEIAKTAKAKAIGLGYRQNLPENKGMVFVYRVKEVPGFWMKGMNFPIDIIWIIDGEVVGCESDVPVVFGNNYPIYRPIVSVNMVLEVNAGFCQKNRVKTGDKVIWR